MGQKFSGSRATNHKDMRHPTKEGGSLMVSQRYAKGSLGADELGGGAAKAPNTTEASVVYWGVLDM